MLRWLAVSESVEGARQSSFADRLVSWISRVAIGVRGCVANWIVSHDAFHTGFD